MEKNERKSEGRKIKEQIKKRRKIYQGEWEKKKKEKEEKRKKNKREWEKRTK